MIHLATIWGWLEGVEKLYYPETDRWYAIGSSWAGTCLFSAAIFTFVYKHNCHEHRCLRLSWHPDTEGHPVCKKHHPDHPSRGWFRTNRQHPRHASQKH